MYIDCSHFHSVASISNQTKLAYSCDSSPHNTQKHALLRIKDEVLSTLNIAGMVWDGDDDGEYSTGE